VKDKWFLVKLDTNGSNFNMLESLLQNKLVDYVAMDVKHDFKKYSIISWVSNENNVKNISNSIRLLINSDIEYEFRTTIIKWYHTENSLKEIWKVIKWAKNYYLQNYRSWKTLDPNFDWESFWPKEIKIFQNIMLNYVKNCEIRE
jgi:pyruvate formate lyase activating enzyme